MSSRLGFAVFAAGCAPGAVEEAEPAALERIRPLWVETTGILRSRFGHEVVAGDVNGDGFDDVIVNAPGTYFAPAVGPVLYAYHGSSAGLDDDPNWEGAFANAAPLEVRVAVGDVNADGFDDAVVGDFGWDDGELTNVGALHQVLGSPTGLTAATLVAAGEPVESGWFGSDVAAAGDVNGDGYDDMLVAAYVADNGRVHGAGAAFVFHGSALGLESEPAWEVRGKEANDHLGEALAPGGDVNGDGYDDVGVVVDGVSLVFHGSATGLSEVASWVEPNSPAGVQRLGAAGDMNGDGFADMWGREVDGEEDAVVLYAGSPEGLGSEPVAEHRQNVVNGTFAGPAGDIDHDGHQDLFLSSPGLGSGRPGRVSIVLGPGGAKGFEVALDLVGPPAPASLFGTGVAFADIAGDGQPELVVGAQEYTIVDPDTGLFIDVGGAFVFPLK